MHAPLLVLLLAGCAKDGGLTDAASPEVDLRGSPDLRADGLRIEEVYVDRDLSGDKVEFVELTAPPGTPLAGLELRLIDEIGMLRYEVPLDGDPMPASGRWVVGGAGVAAIAAMSKVDQVVGIASWGLDNTAGSVQLVRITTRELLDVVGYGSIVPPPATDPMLTLEGAPAALPSDRGQSIGRREGAPDTDQNHLDFCPMAATPGYPNDSCL